MAKRIRLSLVSNAIAIVLLLLPTVSGAQSLPLGPNQSIPLGWEPSIAVNPMDPSNVIVADGFNIIVSSDGGQTFPTQAAVVATPAGSCGDGAVAFDSQGRAFWSHLDGCGTQWVAAVEQVNPRTGAAVGGEQTFSQISGEFNDDKPWIAADANPSSQYADYVYMVWARLMRSNGGHTQLYFSRSTDHGTTWSPAVAITGLDEDAWSAHIAVGPTGKIYIAFRSSPTSGIGANDSIVVITSSNGGNDLLSGQISRANAIPSISPIAAGGNSPPTLPGVNFWLLGQRLVYVMPDPNSNGRAYLIANSPTGSDPGDVYFTAFDGSSWAPAQIISDAPSGSLQVFPHGAIDNSGTIIATWYDARAGITDASGAYELDVYGTLSHDQGKTWVPNFRLNQSGFQAPDLPKPGGNEPRIGEYIGLTAANHTAFAAWMGNPIATTGQNGYLAQFPVLAPVVLAVRPSFGQATGGTPTAIEGQNFTNLGSTTAMFGRNPANQLVVQSTTGLSVSSPAGTAGTTVDVRAMDFKGASATSTGDQFSYFLPFVPFLTARGGCAPVAVEALVLGADSAPVAGHIVQFQISGQGFASFQFQQSTNVNGQATVIVRQSGFIQVTAQDLTTPSGSATTSFVSPFPVQCTQFPSRPTSASVPLDYGWLWGVFGPFGLRPVPNPCLECGKVETAWALALDAPVNEGLRIDIQFVSADAKQRVGTLLDPSLLGGTDGLKLLSGSRLALESLTAQHAEFIGPIIGFRGSQLARLSADIASIHVALPFNLTHLSGRELVRVVRLDEANSQPIWTDAGVVTVGVRGNTVRAVATVPGVYTAVALEPRSTLDLTNYSHGASTLDKTR